MRHVAINIGWIKQCGLHFHFAVFHSRLFVGSQIFPECDVAIQFHSVVRANIKVMLHKVLRVDMRSVRGGFKAAIAL